MPLQATSGAASYDAFGGGVAAVPNYIEDVFSTWLYTGNGSTQTINNGIDLAGKGGLVWTKSRSVATDHSLVDTARGADKVLHSESTAAQVTYADITAFNSNGYSISDVSGWVNTSPRTYASWTFREQPKFFDVVTYTGTGSARTVAHNLGSVPGCIMVKSTSASGSWVVYHRGVNGGSNPQNYGMTLNATAAQTALTEFWNNTAPTSTQFTVGAAGGETNESGVTYVAYLFAHNAGGFGLSGTDNVISCGSYTGNSSSSGPIINLGYEPQWVLIKNTTTGGYSWSMYDNMRGVPTGPNDLYLLANTSDAEQGAGSGQDEIDFQATGFQLRSASFRYNASGDTYIYIAIRRGPMRTPTTGTSVFFPQAYADVSLGSNNPTNLGANAGFPADLFIHSTRMADSFMGGTFDRLRGTVGLNTTSTGAEPQGDNFSGWATQSGCLVPFNGRYYFSTSGAGNRNHIGWFFRRAPGFFDEVCYSGNGSNPRTISHNLGVAPEMMIVKRRNAAEDWSVYCAYMSSPQSSVLFLNLTDAQDSSTGRWDNTAPTSTVFSLAGLNTNGGTYVNYLFASAPGVSKVGSYTGTGTTQTINCGFTAGARFVLIKRTDSTGDWYVWDSARGIVAGNDPYLLLNSTAAEVTNTDYIDTASTGFEISSTAPAAINANGGTFIFLAIA